MRIECERNEWILRYLEKGSEKSFDNFSKALRDSSQSHLVTAMNNSVRAMQQRPCNANEDKTVPGSECAGGVPVCCTENTAEQTTPSMEVDRTGTGSTQGVWLLLCCYLNYDVNTLAHKTSSVFCW